MSNSERKVPVQKLKLPPRICANCGDPATMVLKDRDCARSVSHVRRRLCAPYQLRWEAAGISR